MADTSGRARGATANLRTKILNFGGFDSSRNLILRGGTLMSIGDIPESLSQQILVGIILVGRLGVQLCQAANNAGCSRPDATTMASA